MPRRKRGHVDYPFLISVGLLVLAGLFILASASFGLSEKTFAEPYGFLKRQLGGVFIGLIAILAAANIDYRFWKRLALPLLVLSAILLFLLFVPGVGANFGTGAKRWIDIGFLSFQPAEIVKVALVIYLAAWLDSRQKFIKNFWLGFFPFSVIVGFVGFFLLLQPDISTFVILSLTSGMLFFVGGGRLRHLALALFIGGLLVLSIVYFGNYNLDRLLVFMNPELDPQGAGYQIKQSLIAIGSGGITGKGFGHSQQKFAYLPEPVGDSIFAVFSEELGFIGNIILLILFLVFLFRGMLIASRAPDQFGKLLASGIVALIFVQIVINIGAFTGLLPITGTPLPFVSYGRSALVSLLGSVGILLNISRYTT